MDSAFLTLLQQQPAPVILLEGTRELPPADAPRLAEFARQLAATLPAATFRTGNAPGADEMFAQGVCETDPTRLEYAVPQANHRRAMRHVEARSLSLDAVGEASFARLLQETERATPSYAWLISQRSVPRFRAKLDYLLRDALKVLGSPEHGFAPANFGIFYVNARNPAKGGTGHTLRVCRENQVPIWTQDDWLKAD